MKLKSGNNSKRRRDRRLRASVATLARPLAPEEIRPGQFVALRAIITEHASDRRIEDPTLGRPEIVRLQWTPCGVGEPMRVDEVCLPFVLVRSPDKTSMMLDVRRFPLAALDPAFGRRAFRALRPRPERPETGESTGDGTRKGRRKRRKDR